MERVNEARTPVLAVDVPSGLNADTGEPQGAAIEAAVTLTVGAPKARPAQGTGLAICGAARSRPRCRAAPLPVDQRVVWTLPEDFPVIRPAAAAATHKGTYGHLAILAGSLGYHGAAVLAARGAQRAQPGLITLYTLEAVYHACAAQLQAVMVSPWLPAGNCPPPTPPSWSVPAWPPSEWPTR